MNAHDEQTETLTDNFRALTLQEIFTTVVTHLRQQGRRAMDMDLDEGTGSCMYRNDDGLKCAVGCLIPDEHYSPLIEGVMVRTLRQRPDHIPPVTMEPVEMLRAVLAKIGIADRVQLDLLVELQQLHDDNPSRDWEEGYFAIASQFGLIVPEQGVS